MLRRDRAAFSLPEILVAIAIIAALSVVAIPAVMNKLTEARAAALAKTLDGINEAIQSYRGNVGRYPRMLSQLSTKPAAGPTAAQVCQGTTPAVNINQWRGPYTSRAFTTGGTRMGDAMIQDTLHREPADNSSTSYGVAYVVVTEVDLAVAELLEQSFDGDSNYATGTVRWTAGVAPTGTLLFGIPVGGC
jgi:prepilin-type N-terminal cleavage/methylation domain-containing protein